MKEEKVINIKFLDSSIWLAYFIDGKQKEIIDNENILYLSVLSLFEIKRKFLEKEFPKDLIREKINFIKNRTIIIELNKEIAERAAEISAEKKIPSLDALIYATALLNKGILLTLDNDFRNLPNAVVM